MRLFIIYDLPTTEDNLKKYYQEFRKNIIKLGFVMLQYSIYCKVYPNYTSMKKGQEKIRYLNPGVGNIRMFYLTEKQYEEIEIVHGSKSGNEIYNTSERYVEI